MLAASWQINGTFEDPKPGVRHSVMDRRFPTVTYEEVKCLDTEGFRDGAGGSAQFNYPAGVAVDGEGNVIVADWGNHRIRRISPDGVVSTLAGSGTVAVLPACRHATTTASAHAQPLRPAWRRPCAGLVSPDIRAPVRAAGPIRPCAQACAMRPQLIAKHCRRGFFFVSCSKAC